jgi:glutaredoxin
LSKVHVIVYSRPGCHLCDEAKEAIAVAQCEASYTLDEINIETSRDLLRKYQFDIPVISIAGVEAFRHRVDATEFRKLIEAHHT